MPDWNSPEQAALSSDVLVKLTHAVVGVYLWEFAQSLDFDWSFLSGKRKFKWVMIFYFLVRYTALAAFITSLIVFDVKTKINCRAVLAVFQFTGSAVGGFATINFALRTIALWRRNWIICVILTALIMGHWSLILHGILIEGVYVPDQGCAISHINNTILTANLIYSMVIDFIVLALTSWKTFRLRNKSRKSLGGLIIQDGLIFFASSVCGNVIATVFMILNLSPIMSVIFNIPAAAISAIAATRAVRKLTRWTSEGPHIFYTHADLPTSGDGSNGPNKQQSAQVLALPTHQRSRTEGGVHVQMETFVAVDETYLPSTTPDGNKGVIRFDQNQYSDDDVKAVHAT
ncbi:unnamed protein product [Somion occarium]|uniref:Integral membrane protein n=1 Tax=Somion occarium TaxID=3059160 RepID=A0ABP1CSW2_9APHY